MLGARFLPLHYSHVNPGAYVNVSKYFFSAFFTAISIALSGANAVAGTKLLALPNGAPVSIRACSIFERNISGYWYLVVDAGNLNAMNNLERLNIRMKFYDDVHVLLKDTSVMEKNLDIPPGETKRVMDDFSVYATDHAPLVECSITSATFYGGAVWKPGTTWKGRLTKVHTTDAPATEEKIESKSAISQAPSPPARATSSSTTLEQIGNAWSDLTSNGVFIHARVQLGSSTPTTIRASDLLLTIKLESGVTMQLAGLDRQAPMAEKTFPSGATPSPQIKPQEDLGALGVITLQPKTPIVLIATFAVPAPAAGGKIYAQDVSIRK